MKIVSNKEFEHEILDQLINRGKLDVNRVIESVEQIIRDVKNKGNHSLIHYTNKYENVNIESA